MTIAALVAGLAGSFVLELAVLHAGVRAQVPYLRVFNDLPFVAIDDRGPLYAHAASWIATALGLLALFQTAALAGLTRLLAGTESPLAVRIVTAGSIVMALCAFAAPLITSFDVYAYAGSGLLALQAYHPPAHAFAGPATVLSRLDGAPFIANAYGPAWLAIEIAFSRIPSLLWQVLAYRALGLAAFAACLFAMRRLGVPFGVRALAMLNPALAILFVTDAHNDIVPIALVLSAASLADRRPVLAAALGVLAGGMKLPFIAIAALAFAREPARTRRLRGGALVVAGGTALTMTAIPLGYRDALTATARIYTDFRDPLATALHGGLALFAVLSIALALVTGQKLAGAWSFAGLGATLFPWYLAWGLPYAVVLASRLATFLAVLPVLAFALQTFARSELYPVVGIFTACAFLLAGVLERRRAAWGVEAAPGVGTN